MSLSLRVFSTRVLGRSSFSGSETGTFNSQFLGRPKVLVPFTASF
jgi:hypothetical protein